MQISLGYFLHGIFPLRSHTHMGISLGITHVLYKMQLKTIIITKPLGILPGIFPEFQHVGILKPWEIPKLLGTSPGSLQGSSLV